MGLANTWVWVFMSKEMSGAAQNNTTDSINSIFQVDLTTMLSGTMIGTCYHWKIWQDIYCHLWIPNSAVLVKKGKKYIYILNESACVRGNIIVYLDYLICPPSCLETCPSVFFMEKD